MVAGEDWGGQEAKRLDGMPEVAVMNNVKTFALGRLFFESIVPYFSYLKGCRRKGDLGADGAMSDSNDIVLFGALKNGSELNVKVSAAGEIELKVSAKLTSVADKIRFNRIFSVLDFKRSPSTTEDESVFVKKMGMYPLDGNVSGFEAMVTEEAKFASLNLIDFFKSA